VAPLSIASGERLNSQTSSVDEINWNSIKLSQNYRCGARLRTPRKVLPTFVTLCAENLSQSFSQIFRDPQSTVRGGTKSCGRWQLGQAHVFLSDGRMTNTPNTDNLLNTGQDTRPDPSTTCYAQQASVSNISDASISALAHMSVPECLPPTTEA
jgi:hypothetical protein